MKRNIIGKILFTSDDKVKENNVNKNEDFANLLIAKFNIEDFFYEIYPSSKNINQNLLDELFGLVREVLLLER